MAVCRRGAAFAGVALGVARTIAVGFIGALGAILRACCPKQKEAVRRTIRFSFTSFSIPANDRHLGGWAGEWIWRRLGRGWLVELVDAKKLVESPHSRVFSMYANGHG